MTAIAINTRCACPTLIWDGNLARNSSFAGRLTLFSASGVFIDDNDDGAGAAVDPVTGVAGDARITANLAAGSYILALTQYDNFSHALGANARLKWTVQPGNDVFVIVNQGYDTTDDRFRPTRNDTSVKGAWTFRF